MTLATRDQIPLESTWDLKPIYPSIDEWRRDFALLEPRVTEMAAFAGTLGGSAQALERAIRFSLESERTLEKLYNFAHLISDQDTANTEHLGLLESARNLFSRWSAASSFITPEILSIPEERLQHFLEDPCLADLKRTLSEIIRYKPHTLSKEEENLLAQGGEVFAAPGQIFSQLNNADLEFGTVTVDGSERTLTHGSFMVLLQDRRREIREQTFSRYYKVFKAHKNTIAATLASSIKRDVYLARVRRFPSALEGSLFGDAVSPAVYDNLISAVSDNLAPLHRYYELRKRMLKLPDLQIYDTYVPLVPDVETKHPYADAAQLVADSLKPLGDEYSQTLRHGLTDARWVDVFENKGKKSGAYSSGCYDSPPYILMNYKEDHLHDIFTLAHEAGHSMHSYYSSRNQPYQDHSYTIFVAEVASTFNEQLLLKELKTRYQNDKRMLAYLTNQQIDDIKATLYRQTMFAEFEKVTHEMAEKNQPLTVDVFRSIYRTLLKKYFGAAVALHEDADLECLRIPHFYSAFYVYKYATGISAAITLADKVMSGDKEALRRYLGFLSAGCTKHPIDLLRDAGVDMGAPEAVSFSLSTFNRLVGELERLLPALEHS